MTDTKPQEFNLEVDDQPATGCWLDGDLHVRFRNGTGVIYLNAYLLAYYPGTHKLVGQIPARLTLHGNPWYEHR